MDNIGLYSRSDHVSIALCKTDSNLRMDPSYYPNMYAESYYN